MRALLLTSTALALLTPMSAFAQSASSASSDTKASVLQEVVVTAERRSESLEKAPVAVQAVTGSAIAAKGITDLASLSNLTPALTVQPTANGNLIFMRGVGNFTLTINSDPAIAYNYDGVYIGRPLSGYGAFYDLDRVEVLKGPQGILYGRNATGGAINVIPTKPILNQYSGYASVDYGNYNGILAQAAVNVPVNDFSAVRIAGSYSSHDGYLKDGTDDDNTKALRIQYLADLTPKLKLRVAGDIAQTDDAGASVSWVGKWTLNPITNQYTFSSAGVPPVQDGVYSPAGQAYGANVFDPQSGRNLNPQSPYPHQNNTYGGVNAELTYDSPIGTVTFIPAYRLTKLNQIGEAGGFTFLNKEDINEYSGELRLGGTRGIVDYTAGFYYYNSTDDSPITGIGFQDREIWLSDTFKTQSYAPFGAVTFHLADQFRITGGLRYTTDDKSVNGTGELALLQCLIPTGCPTGQLFTLTTSPSQEPFALPPVGGAAPQAGHTGELIITAPQNQNNSLTQSRLTWRAGAEYDITPHSMSYVSVETGYRSGGFNNAVGFETYQPETITAYTVGVKNRLFDHRLLLNVEGFYWDYKNQQISQVGIDLTGHPAQFIQNLGGSVMKGVEVDGIALLTPTTQVSADIQYLDAEATHFTYLSAKTGTVPPLTACAFGTYAPVPTENQIDCSGKPDFNAPKWTITLGIQQSFPVSDSYEVVVNADTRYETSRYAALEYEPQDIIPADWISNAQISFGPTSKRWKVGAYVRNIEGNRVPNFVVGSSTLVEGVSAPRTYGMQVSAKF